MRHDKASYAVLPSDEWLGGCLRRIAAGGEEATAAIAELYRVYRLRVLAHLLRSGLSPDAAEDVLHAVFVKVAEHAGQWQGTGPAGAWLWTIVRNARTDMFRVQPREIDVDEEVWRAIAEQVASDASGSSSQAVQRCVHRAFQRFAWEHPERAEALRLLHLEQWSIAQVAAFIGRTAGATKEFLSQCRRVFRPYLQPCLDYLDS